LLLSEEDTQSAAGIDAALIGWASACTELENWQPLATPMPPPGLLGEKITPLYHAWTKAQA